MKFKVSPIRRFFAGLLRVMAVLAVIFAMGVPDAWADGNIGAWQSLGAMVLCIVFAIVLVRTAEDVEGV